MVGITTTQLTLTGFVRNLRRRGLKVNTLWTAATTIMSAKVPFTEPTLVAPYLVFNRTLSTVIDA